MEEAKAGYEVYEDKRTFDKDKDYLEGYSYPCMIVSISADVPIPKSRMQTLKSMLNSATVDTNITTEPVNLYFKSSDKTMLIGKLQARQVKSFLKLFEGVNIVGYLTSDQKLEGDFLYVLSS